MFNKILAAIDYSIGSKQVFNEALSVAKADGANLILMHVLSVEEGGSPPMSRYLVQHKNRCIHVNPSIMRLANEADEREWSEFKQKGIKLLRSYSEKAIAAGIKTEFTQVTGQPSSTICEFARSCHADVIVIGRRGHSDLKEMFLGSVSNYVVHHAPCSVLLVQTPILEESTLTEDVNNTVYV